MRCINTSSALSSLCQSLGLNGAVLEEDGKEGNGENIVNLRDGQITVNAIRSRRNACMKNTSPVWQRRCVDLYQQSHHIYYLFITTVIIYINSHMIFITYLLQQSLFISAVT